MKIADKETKSVERLIEKAASAEKSEDAMRFSQSACNAANALFALSHLQPISRGSTGPG